MKILLLSIVLLAIVSFIIGYFREKNIQEKIEKGELEDYPEAVEIDAECCGQHEICEKESLIAAVSQSIEYYDDEELDQFKGFSAEEYTSEQADQFRDIFYTMLDTDVAGWVRSLQHRGIELPEEIKDEVFLIVGERRAKTVQH
ncbi:MAG: phospholipase [Bacteroidales bacterium]|nr:phospholipase [Bacteroidales bacterium]